jgi:hypothetical protein
MEEGSFVDAVMDEAEMPGVQARRASFAGASLVETDLTDADLTDGNLQGADLRRVLCAGVRLSGASIQGAKVFGLAVGTAWPEGVEGDWVDSSRAGNGSERTSLVAFRAALFSDETAARKTRSIGLGDRIANAELTFDDGAEVAIDGELSDCTINMGQGASLRIGHRGLLERCIVRGGSIHVDGRFLCNDQIGLDRPVELVVTRLGAVATVLQQPAKRTHFGFESGCRLRLRITNPETASEENSDAE